MTVSECVYGGRRMRLNYSGSLEVEMRILTVLFTLGALLLLPMNGVAETTMITFEDLTTGATVEGPNTLYPGMDLQSMMDGAAVVIETFNTPKAFGAPTPDNRSNACLEDENGIRIDYDEFMENGTIGKGFGYPQAGAPFEDWSYVFTFEPGYGPSSFAIRVFDFGDYNPTNATEHGVSLTAYDWDDNQVDIDELSYTTNGSTNPTDSDPFGDLLYAAGDACTADFGQPGYFELMVEWPLGIKRIELTATGQDPKVGFDSLKLVECTRTIGYWKNHDWDGMVIESDVLGVINQELGRGDDPAMKPRNGLLWMARSKDLTMVLAQWIAAKLNCYDYGHGSTCSADMLALLDDVEQLFKDEEIDLDGFDLANPNMEMFMIDKSDKDLKRRASMYSEMLDAFNNSILCDDAPEIEEDLL